jgi:sporulation protein YlmC with PRC-barrel domain
MDTHANEIDDWQSLVNKPVYANDGREVGVVRSI